MKKADVEIGGYYVAKVSGDLQVVRVLKTSTYGGWDARNERTGRWVRIKSARRLRRRAHVTEMGTNYGR